MGGYEDTFIELNKAVHDRASFDCGNDELNTFMHCHAARHMKVGISRTMVLPELHALSSDKHSICVFFTIAPSSIKRESLPEKSAKKLPRYPVPVFLLAQLAVDSRYQGCGLGKITLIKGLEYLWNVQFHMKAYAVIVDCIDLQAEQFYLQYGFQELVTDESHRRLFLPMATVGKLFS